MSMPPRSRREFLASVTAAGAVSLVTPRSLDARTQRRSIGANDRIRIGVSGCGSRGFGTDAKQCRSVDELLALADVDAVFISSPDHWHSAHLEAATSARKHVYVEKPMAI